MLVAFDMPEGRFTVLNVYNGHGVENPISHILNHAYSLPSVQLMVGDFNLHHPSWDRRTRESVRQRILHGTKVTVLWDLSV